MKHSIPTFAVSLLGLAGGLTSAWAGLNAPVIRQDANIDPFLSTAGAQVAAANLGSTAPVTRNGVAFPPVAVIGANPAGTNWSVVAPFVDQSLGGFASIDPLFFSESFGGDPVSLTVTNLDSTKTYVVQILHGEPRSSFSGTFTTNDFLLSSGAILSVPGFTIGNGIAGENPPRASDRAIVEVELQGITTFTYRMKSGTGRGPSIAGFQVRELPIVLSGGGLTLVEEDGGIASGNLSALGTSTAFAKDVLPGFSGTHEIAHLKDQNFGNGKSWIGNSAGTFAGVSFGAAAVPVSSIAFGRDNTVNGFTDRTLGLYTLQYTAVANPTKDTPETSWTTIGTLNYQTPGGTNFTFPSKRHRYTFNRVTATGIRLLVPTGACIDELEVYSGIVVTTTEDEDNGSLGGGAGISVPEAVKYSPAGSIIDFAPSLSGKTIILGGTQLLITKSLTIDASSLPNGITINANGQSRVMEIQPNSTVALRGLTLTGGMATGNFPANGGGAIFANGSGSGNSVSLSLSSCTLSGNSASGIGGGIYSNGRESGSATLTLSSCTLSGNSNNLGFGGGGIYSDGRVSGSATLSLSSCTLSGNSASAGFGGGIYSDGTESGSAALSLSSCTLSGNSASPLGGGIYSTGRESGSATLSLSSCTLSGNSASAGSGGGIYSEGRNGSATLSLNNSILAGNTARTGPDLEQSIAGATTTATGNNLMSSLDGSNIGAQAQANITVPTTPLLLSPLGHYGGPTQTMHPLSGSPAVLSGDETRTDQRGFTLTGPPTIGAVMQGHITEVTNLGELRTALSGSANIKGSVIRFGTSLNGQTITLTGGQLLVPSLSDGLFIDASSLPNGLTINANGAVTNHRVMEIQPNSSVALHGLTLTGGKATGRYFPASSSGGAIYANGRGAGNFVRLSLSSCTLSGNSTSIFGFGGGIYSDGFGGSATLTLSSCTLSGNSAPDGGGIYSEGRESGSATLSLSSCTLSGNSASSQGGGIYSVAESGSAPLTLSSCTLSGNSASGSGGGIYTTSISGIANTILAGNTASNGPDLRATFTTLTTTGNNLISSLDGHPLTAGTSVTVVADPRLAPLANYGGPTQTMALRPGSPARNAATGSARTTDQRGFPIVGIPDIGAYEAGTLSNYNAFIWESLPNTATIAQTATTFDFDGDGQSNESEWNAGTLPADANSILRITSLTRSGGNLLLTFPSVSGKSYTLWQNDTLTAGWTNTGLTAIIGDGSVKEFTIPAPVAGIPKRFYRVQVQP